MSLTRDEASDLLRRCISNTKSLRTIIDEDHMKKLNMKSIADLRKALDNIVAELEFRADGILDSMMSAKDPMIAFNNLHALMASVHSLHAISDRINNSLVVVHVRKAYYDGKVRTKLSTLNENYIHLLTTLSWDNVKKTEVIEAPPAPLAVCNHYEEGYKHFYGIGRPRNFSLALDRFRDAMNVDNHPDAIIYVSDYYLLCLGGIGVDIGSKEDKQQTFYLSTRNRISKVFELLEHAHELGSQEAKYRLASLILIRECSPELLYNTNEGNANTIETKKYQSTFYSHSLLREILEKIYEDTSGDNDCLESNMNTFGNGQDGNGFFSPAGSSRAEPNATSEVDNKLGQTQSVGQSYDFSKLHLFSSVTSLKSSMRKPLTTENAMIASLNKTVSKQQSIDRALQLYAEASEGGHAASQRQYGLICELLGNYHEAVQYYKYASENGDGDAYNCLALLYHHGASSSIDYDADHTEHVSVDMGTSLRNNVYTIHQDYNMAFALFANAANAGCSCAYNNIGLYYEKQLIASSKENHKEINHYGMTIRNHLLDALYYYSMGAKAGSVMSMYNYGYLLIQIYTKYMSIHTEIDTNSNQYTDMMSDGLHWLRCAADYGNLDANFQLGVIYESGFGVASRDYQCAFQQYKHVFDAGVARQSKELVLLCAKAAWHAGKLIYYEKVVTASVDEMMAFLLYAALYGSHVDAILLLSSVYYHGCNDVDVDMLKACAWLYEGVILCSSNECLIKLLHALIQLHSSDELKSAYWSDDGKLLFQLIDNTILTNIEFVNNLHEYIISTKYKDNCIESEYHVIYALLMQLSALITK